MKYLAPAIFLSIALNSGLFAQKASIFNSEKISELELQTYRSESDELQKTLKKFKVFEINTQGIYHQIQTQNSSNVHFQLYLEDQYTWNLSLELNDTRSKDDFKGFAQVNGETITLPKKPASTYKGYLTDMPSSKTRLSIRENAILGFVEEKGERIYIEPMTRYNPNAPQNWFVVYNLEDVLDDENTLCGTSQDVVEELLESHLEEYSKKSTHQRTISNECTKAKIAIAADGGFTNKMGGLSTAETEIYDIFNLVEDTYLHPDINIRYEISALFISGSIMDDPWAYTDGQTLATYLQTFANWGNAGGFGTQDFAIASMWTAKNFPPGVRGIAYVGTVCTIGRYNMNRHAGNNIPRHAQTQAHEIGHNWSGQHVEPPGSYPHTPNQVFIMATSTSTANKHLWSQSNLVQITTHKNSRTCLSDDCEISPNAIFFSDAMVSCGSTVSFTDMSQNYPTAWEWDFGDGNTSMEQNPTHTYENDGEYTVSLTVSNMYGNNTVVKDDMIIIHDTLSTPNTTNDERCGEGEVTLTASGEGELNWYDAPTGGNLVHTGTTYTLDLTETTSFYVESYVENSAPQFVGPQDNSIGAGEYYNYKNYWGLTFDVHTPVVIKSVKVYSSWTGWRTVEIHQDSKIIFSKDVNLGDGEQIIELGAMLNTGQDYLIKIAGPILHLYKNTNSASYPYELTGVLTITGNNSTLQNEENDYFFFYDWEIDEPGCSSARGEVQGIITSCAGLEELGNDNAITIFPNPTSGEFSISFDLKQQNDIKLEIYNVVGKNIHSTHFKSVDSHTSILDMGNYSSGIYTLKIEVGNNTYYKKLIKE